MKYINSILILSVGICIGIILSHSTDFKTVEITDVDISKELVDALKVSGCLSLPFWDTRIPGIQICTYGEIMHRGWIYSKEQVKKRIEERKKQ